MTPKTFAAILEDRLKHVEDAVALIEQGDGGAAEINTMRGNLVDILKLVERNPGIEAAADDLHDLAAGTVVANARERQQTSRGRRVLRDALTRLKERLATAQPVARTRT
jgi:hypothetical protein